MKIRPMGVELFRTARQTWRNLRKASMNSV